MPTEVMTKATMNTLPVLGSLKPEAKEQFPGVVPCLPLAVPEAGTLALQGSSSGSPLKFLLFLPSFALFPNQK